MLSTSASEILCATLIRHSCPVLSVANVHSIRLGGLSKRCTHTRYAFLDDTLYLLVRRNLNLNGILAYCLCHQPIFFMLNFLCQLHATLKNMNKVWLVVCV